MDIITAFIFVIIFYPIMLTISAWALKMQNIDLIQDVIKTTKTKNDPKLFKILILHILILFIIQMCHLSITTINNPSNLVTEINIYSILALTFGSVIIIATFEELIFRGCLLNSLLHKLSFKNSVVINSLIFAVIHDPELFVESFMISILFCLYYINTRNIWQTVLLHAISNALPVISIIIKHLLYSYLVIDISTYLAISSLNIITIIMSIMIVIYAIMLYQLYKNYWPQDSALR